MDLDGDFSSGSPEGWFVSNSAGSSQSAITYDATGGVGSSPCVQSAVSLVGNHIRRLLPLFGDMNVTVSITVKASSIAVSGIVLRLANGATSIAQTITGASLTTYQTITVSGSFTSAHGAPAIAVMSGGGNGTLYISDWSIDIIPVSPTVPLSGGFNWGDTVDWVLNNASSPWAARIAATAKPGVVSSGGRSGYAVSTSADTSGVGIVSVMRRMTMVDGQSNNFSIWVNGQVEGITNFRLRVYSTTGSVLAEKAIPGGLGYQLVSLQYTPPTTTDVYVSFEHGVNALTGVASVLWDDWVTAAQPLTSTYVRVGGVWLPATRFVRVGGVWQPAAMYLRRDGVWQSV